jgi:DNA processing protein
MTPMTDDERLDAVCLSLVSGVGPVLTAALLDAFGSATRALDASPQAIGRVPGIGPKVAARIASARRDLNASEEMALATKAGVHIVVRGEPEYPALLHEVPDPPALLYVRGQVDPVADSAAIAIVGSRKCTLYGERTARRLAASLARIGVTIVSGLARGIDAAAHRGALEAGGRTLAVLADGLQTIYPPEHADLAHEVERSGALISEMPMRHEPLASLFPRRNRIIAGLSLGVIVVEAAPRSGSLSTANHATEQNREVFAVPGPVDSLASRGCHALLKDGATLVETIDDVIQQLGDRLRPAAPPPVTQSPDPEPRPAPLSAGGDDERRLLNALDDQPRSVDELIAATGLPASAIIGKLALMEMRRQVKRVPGNLFVRP